MTIPIQFSLRYLLRTFLLLLIFSFFAVALQAEPLRIMTLGNSITQGNMEHPSYRYPLWKKLIDAQVEFEYVGSHNENDGGIPKFGEYKGQKYTNWNEGHWGWSTDEILNGKQGQPNKEQLGKWLKQYTPDMVLLHLGTNDMFRNQDLDETIAELREVVRQIRAEAPNVTILMAQLIPAYDQKAGPTAAQNIDRLNARIPGLVQELNRPESPVLLVDQNTGFDPTTGVDTWDGIHPNGNGEEKMAQRWFEAITSQIIVPLPVELHSFKGIATGSSVQLSWKTATEQDNHYFEVQRSLNATVFEAIGQVEGTGTTAIAQHYSFEDKDAPAGTNYYRLRQVDFSGEQSYSAVVAVTYTQDEAVTMQLYPTRTKGDPVTLEMRALKPQEKFKVGIYTLEGKLVQEFVAKADEQGNYSERIRLGNLKNASLYMVRASTGDQVYLRHLLVDM